MTQSFLYTYVCFWHNIILKKTLAKVCLRAFSALEKNYGLRYRLPTHWSYFTNKILVNIFGSGSCLQIYRFCIPDQNYSLYSFKTKQNCIFYAASHTQLMITAGQEHILWGPLLLTMLFGNGRPGFICHVVAKLLKYAKLF